MPRKYNRMIRFYDSWFDDLTDRDKELTSEEIVQVIWAVRECQHTMDLLPIDNLPISIKRALSMSTFREQMARILERVSGARDRGSIGGNVAAGNYRSEEHEREQREREEVAVENGELPPSDMKMAEWVKFLRQQARRGDELAAIMLQHPSQRPDLNTPEWHQRIVHGCRKNQVVYKWVYGLLMRKIREAGQEPNPLLTQILS